MIWFIEKLKVENQNITDAMAVYKQCCDNMNKLYLMALKFEISNDLSIMRRINDQLLVQYRSEYEALTQFHSTARICYYSSQKLI